MSFTYDGCRFYSLSPFSFSFLRIEKIWRWIRNERIIRQLHTSRSIQNQSKIYDMKLNSNQKDIGTSILGIGINMDNRIYRAPIEIHQNRCSKGYSSYAFANSVRRRRTYGQRQLLRAHFWDAFVATNDNTMGTARRLSASHRPTDPRPLHAFVTCTLGSARRAATAGNYGLSRCGR